MKKLEAITGKRSINVVIETPKGCRNKFSHQPETGYYKLSKVLPAGTSFPFDFGFIPGTQAEDGDALDVLVMVETDCFPGCLIECRVIGILEALQQEKGKKEERNDRIVAVALESIDHSGLAHIRELNKNLLNEVLSFFEYYNKMRNKRFRFIGVKGPDKAMKLIKKHITTT